MENVSIYINSLDELDEAARQIVQRIANHKIIAFYGKMGAGKTTLIKALCRVMGVDNVVSSPTFSLVNEYHTRNGDTIYHFDFYRINKIEEAFDFGYEEYFFSNNYCFIEWPEKIESLLPADVMKMNVEEQNEGVRLLTIG